MTKYTSFAPEFDGDVLACRCRKEIRGHIEGCRLNEFGFGLAVAQLVWKFAIWRILSLQSAIARGD